MDQSPESLEYEDDDLQLFAVEPLSEQMRVSRAFVRLCLATGCPSRRGRMSAAELLNWLFDNYEPVRELAGLSTLAPVLVENPIGRRIRMANALHTIAEFSESRASDPLQKRALSEMATMIERALERS